MRDQRDTTEYDIGGVDDGTERDGSNELVAGNEDAPHGGIQTLSECGERKHPLPRQDIGADEWGGKFAPGEYQHEGS